MERKPAYSIKSTKPGFTSIFFFYVAGFMYGIIPGKMQHNLLVKCMCFIPIGSMYIWNIDLHLA